MPSPSQAVQIQPSQYDIVKSPEFTISEIHRQKKFVSKTTSRRGKHALVDIFTTQHPSPYGKIAVKTEIIFSPLNILSRPYREYHVSRQLTQLKYMKQHYPNSRWAGFVELLDWFKSRAFDSHEGSVARLPLSPTENMRTNHSHPSSARTCRKADSLLQRKNTKSSFQEGNLILENADCTLNDRKGDLSFETYRSVLFQALFAVYLAQRYYSFVHNDLHLKNILLKRSKLSSETSLTDENVGIFCDADKTWYSTSPWIVKISDFGLSRIKMMGLNIHSPGHPNRDAFRPEIDTLKIWEEFSKIKVKNWLCRRDLENVGVRFNDDQLERLFDPMDDSISLEAIIQQTNQESHVIKQLSDLKRSQKKLLRNFRIFMKNSAHQVRKILDHEFFDAMLVRPPVRSGSTLSTACVERREVAARFMANPFSTKDEIVPDSDEACALTPCRQQVTASELTMEKENSLACELIAQKLSALSISKKPRGKVQSSPRTRPDITKKLGVVTRSMACATRCQTSAWSSQSPSTSKKSVNPVDDQKGDDDQQLTGRDPNDLSEVISDLQELNLIPSRGDSSAASTVQIESTANSSSKLNANSCLSANGSPHGTINVIKALRKFNRLRQIRSAEHRAQCIEPYVLSVTIKTPEEWKLFYARQSAKKLCSSKILPKCHMTRQRARTNKASSNR